MKTKILLICSLFLFAFNSALWAQGQSQVDYTAGVGQRTVRDSAGPVPNGNEVWIGAFDPTFNVTANANNPAALKANWTRYGWTRILTWGPPFNQAGSFNGSATTNSVAFNNRKIYLWIFSTDNAESPAQNFSNVNEYGLFSSTDSQWLFPDPNAPFPGNTRSINTDQVNQQYFGSFNSTRLLLSGGFILVPEPSTLALLSLAIPAVVLALRKRRSNR